MSLFVLFHTIIIDFILTLSKSRSDFFDSIMFVTYKYIKRVICISEKITYSATQWARVLLERLDIVDWEILKVIISDKDKKFLSNLWSEIFQRLSVRLLYSIAYHSQTNDQSKRTNQTVEIALRFAISTLSNSIDWSTVLSNIQRSLNNSISNATSKTSNEVSYDFTSIQSIDLLTRTRQIN